jgi:hypothetical protein
LLDDKITPNIVSNEIAKLEAEIAEVEKSYEEAVQNIRKDGWKYIFGEELKEGKEDDDKPSSSNRFEEEVAHPGDCNPEVSILPIDNLPQPAEQVIGGTEPFIGKGKDQIEQAISMAEVAAASEKAAQETKATAAGVSHEEL